MRILTSLFLVLLTVHAATAEPASIGFTLPQVIAYGLEHNARLRSAHTNVAIEAAGMDAAKADRMPRLDGFAGVSTYRYPAPVVPIYITPGSGITISNFDTTLYDAGVTFAMPLYRGGRLTRGVTIAGMRRSIAEDLYRMTRQELLFNLTSTYYKILQLEKFLAANEKTAEQFEAHKKNVETALKAGTAAKVDLLKIDTELAHANQATLISKNNLESAQELLKVLMGMEDQSTTIRLADEPVADEPPPSYDACLRSAFALRPDYQAAGRSVNASEERVALAQGRRLPSLTFTTDYVDKSGTDFEFRENWTMALRLTLPLFEGGSISADVGKARAEQIKAKEDERALRLDITREIRDALLNIENAGARIDVAATAITSARENLRIEELRYRAGSGTTTDVIDAQTALLRAETDYYQALYDKGIAWAALRKAIGKEPLAQGDER
jgi:outer membrane protein